MWALGRVCSMNDVTHLLAEIQRGMPQAAEQLLPLVYDELRKLARARLAKEKPGHTLDATGLVHEAYLRLIGPSDGRIAQWDGRGHFFAAAAEAMRRILVENARRKKRVRHGGELQRVEMHDDVLPVRVQASDEDILAVHEALDELEPADPQAARLVKLHYFLGVPFAEAAELMGISERTAYRTWLYARAWLYKRFADHP
jgi:RNA polymerase sigma factor (TIGR02999 family)